MTTKDRRKHARINALNLISYSCIDETVQAVTQGMGRTLNVSQGGILLETHVPIDPSHTVALAIGLEDDLINIKGRVVFSMAGREDRFEAGIEFIEIDEAALDVLKKYIKAFKGQD
ncbi:MAG: PilZ domain-containing protein [Desulfobacterales bacterium]|jgi:c-di-GMP-binding flagellar brake protein YcgR